MKNETIFPQIFPQGDRLPEEFSRYFTGQAYLASISNNEALGTHISVSYTHLTLPTKLEV